ncbi:MAG: aryl-sulfate sulfotransferase [Eubacterium sp.]|nr:aryl-sulfate sulfotransferase [Eubacterium sp.]
MESKGNSGKVLAIAAAIAVLLIVLVSVALAYSGRDVTILKDRTLHLNFNGYAVEVPLAEDGAVFDAPCLMTERDNEVTLLNDAGASVKINKKNLATGKTQKVTVEKIAYNELLRVEVTSSKDSRTIFFRTQSSRLPQLTVEGESAYNGEYYMTAADAPTMYKLNEKGEYTYYVALDPETNGDVRFSDFRKHVLDNGDVRYSYHQNAPEYTGFASEGYTLGSRVILDEKYKKIGKDDEEAIYLLESDNASGGEPVDNQSFVLLGDKHYIVSGQIQETAEGTDNKVAAQLIQEVDNGKVVFEWKSTDYPELYELSEGGASGDYFHMTDMLVDPSDDNLIIASKNTNTILKISRENGEILWKLSGKADDFGLSEAQKITAPQGLQLTEDGELVVFSAGNPDKITRLTLDEEAKAVTKRSDFTAPAGSKADGSAQLLDAEANAFGIGWGQNDDGALVTEYNFSTNKTVFSVKTADAKAWSARALKYAAEEK